MRSETGSLTPDSVFELLSNHRRRMVLYYLRRSGESIGIQQLAARIASVENDVPVDELTSQQRKRVYVSLYQTHLPKMAEMDTIEYDKESGTVRLTERADDIDAYLTTSDRQTYPWRFHYLLLAIAATTVLISSALNVPVFDVVPTSVLVACVLVAVAGSVVGQYWQIQNREEEIPIELTQYER
ncbi:DUF7344 domain-containing protein [Halorubrum cibi]|nr:hypothetical protein [Halorubrum cibi]